MTKRDLETVPTPLHEEHVLFLGGFGYGAKRNQRVADQLAGGGLQVIPPPPDAPRKARKEFAVTHLEGEEQTLSRADTVRAHLGRVPFRSIVALSQLDQAAALQVHIEQEVPEGTKVSIIAQSADAQTGILYTANNPGHVENLILVNPAGIVPQPRLDKAAVNVLGSVFKARRRGRGVPPESLFEQRGRRRGKLGSFANAASVALSDQRDILHQIRQSNDAPGVAIVLGLEDLIVQPENVIKGLLSTDDVDRILIADMTHGINGRKDILARVAALLPQLRDDKIASERGEAPASLSEKISFFGDIPSSVQEHFLGLARQRESPVL